MIFTAPAIVTVVGWAITSYVITGVFFAEFASNYSNTAAIKYNLFLNFHGRVLYELHCIEALGLFLPLLLVASLVVAIARRDARLLAPMALLGGALASDLILFLKGDITASFRYFILALPFDIFLVGSLVAAIQAPRPTLARAANSLRVSPTRGRTLPAVAAVMLIVAIMVPTAVTTGTALLNPNVGTYESAQIGWIFHAHPSEWDIENKNNYNWILSIGNWFTSRHLPDGDVLTDAASCMSNIITTIAQPKIFVIPNDRDFQRILADPISFHTHYILEADPTGSSGTDTSIEYPTLWRTGAGFTKMVHEFPKRAACPAFRLFRVTGQSNTVT